MIFLQQSFIVCDMTMKKDIVQESPPKKPIKVTILLHSRQEVESHVRDCWLLNVSSFCSCMDIAIPFIQFDECLLCVEYCGKLQVSKLDKVQGLL